MNKKNKFYAIKKGKGVKDKIVTDWDECKKYVLGYPAVYKVFATEDEAKEYLNEMTDEMILSEQLWNQEERILRLRIKILKKYGFYISPVITYEMSRTNNYNDLCEMIDSEISRGALSAENAKILKRDLLEK